jgi:hypothetical protein
MNEEQLISAIAKRAAHADTRTDFANIRSRQIGPRATPEMIRVTEQRLGFSLQPFHRRLLETVENGGFGPGDGLIGTTGGSLDVDGRSLDELHALLWPNKDIRVVPLCEWGDGIWSCVDVATASVLTMSELGLFNIDRSLRSWFEGWVSGENLWQQIVVLETAKMQNPLTKEFVTVPMVKGIRGAPYIPAAR